MSLLSLSPMTAVPLELRSQALLHWRGSDLTISAPLSGHVGTFTRASSISTNDSASVGSAIAHAEPGWEVRNAEIGVRCVAADRWRLGEGSSGLSLRPRAMSVLLSFRQLSGTVARLYLGNSGRTGARFYIDHSGSAYRVTHHNGSASVSAVLSASPANGDRVQIIALLHKDGSVQISQVINETTLSTSLRSSALTPALSYPSDTYWWVNSLGDASGGSAWYDRILAAPDIPDINALMKFF